MVERSPDQGADDFSISESISNILEDGVVSEVTKFLGTTAPLQLRVTTAQQCANMNDHRDIAVVFDMRTAKEFSRCALDKSINLPLERFNEQTFFNWPKEATQIEKDATICTNAFKVERVKRRKRYWVFIIASQSDAFLKENLLRLH
jgi:hypothetical protein